MKIGKTAIIQLFSDLRRKGINDAMFRTLIESLWRDSLQLYKEQCDKGTAAEPTGYLPNEFSELIDFGQALGQDNLIEGNRSTAIGQGLNTKAFMELLLGAYATIAADQDPDNWVATDRLAALANGTDDENRSLALEIFKSGLVKFLNGLEIGKYNHGAVVPADYTLSKENAGLSYWLNDSWNLLAGFDLTFEDTEDVIFTKTGSVIKANTKGYTGTFTDKNDIVWTVLRGLIKEPAPLITLTFDDIVNVPVANVNSLSDWNTLFNLPTLGIPFTALSIDANSVTLIGGSGIILKDYIFQNSINLIKFEDKSNCIISIGTYCFQNCINLITVALHGITTGGQSCFEGCVSMVDTIFDNLITLTGDSCFRSCTSLVNPEFPKLTTLGGSTFNLCINLVNPDFSSLTTIDSADFKDCFNLISSFPNLETTLSLNNFYECSSMVYLNFPKLSIIAPTCFRKCYAVSNINLPLVSQLGTTVGYDGVFRDIIGNTITLIIPTALMTCNGGAPDGDIQYLQANNTVTIIEV